MHSRRFRVIVKFRRALEIAKNESIVNSFTKNVILHKHPLEREYFDTAAVIVSRYVSAFLAKIRR